MSEWGQTRSFGDVGSMSGLPESGHDWAIYEYKFSWGPDGAARGQKKGGKKWRRSLSCMIAGILIVIPAWLLEVFGHDWQPPGVVVIAIVWLSIPGVAWLYDEIQETGRPSKKSPAGSGARHLEG
jgi:hypothetical protein